MRAVGLLFCAAICLGPVPAASAQSAENVAVVVNDDSADSRRIGEHYARTRGLPDSNVLRIHTSTDEAIDREQFVRTIELPLGTAIRRAGLQDRLLYLVLTRGVPLRVVGTAGLAGTLASVDSELTLLYRRIAGQAVALQGAIDNPYFLGSREIADARPFSHRAHDIFLVTRLDAFTVEQALALVDRARTPSADGRVVLDESKAGATADQWFQRAAGRLAQQAQQSGVAFERPSDARGGKPVIAYYLAGASARARGGPMTFAPGSIAASLASFEARTFHQPPAGWRPDAGTSFEGSGEPLIADLVREGVTGVAGQVGEAYLLGALRPDVLLPAYLSGFNLAEAFYLAMPKLSWHTVVVGDPLCAPFGRPALTRQDLEEGIDEVTGLPASYSKRRLAAFMAANPEVPAAAGRLALRFQTLIERDDRAGARTALEEAVGLAPRAVGLQVALAQLDESAGEYDAAIARYRSILELQPKNVLSLNNLAFALAVHRKEIAEAIELARRAYSLAPRAGTVIDTVGWIEHLAGNDDEAAKLLGQAVQLEPGHAEIRLHAAIVYAATGNAARAAEELKEAVRLDRALEDRPEVRQLRERIAAIKEPTAR